MSKATVRRRIATGTSLVASLQVWPAILLAAASLGSVNTGIDAPTIIQRSVAANERDWQAAPAYNYFERDHTRDNTKTYFVTMINGSPYRRLVAINGEPLTPGEQAAQEKKAGRYEIRKADGIAGRPSA